MNTYVLDASAWLRLFLGDGAMPVGLDAAAREVDVGRAVFVAPELILVEAAHALHRKVQRGGLTPDEGDALWRDMQCMPLELLRIQEHLEAARALAGGARLSLYDALYLAVARHLGADLFTADKDLARAAAAR